MDSLYLEALLGELQELLPGSRINKVYQPAAAEVIFKLWSRGRTLRLLLSCEAERSRMHLVEGAYPNPAAPPRFCQLLRARLAVLIGLEQVPGERVVRLTFAGSNDSRYQLVAELTGRSANLILVDDQGLVVDALKRVPAEQGRTAIVPGVRYEPPAPPGGDLLDEMLTEPPSGGVEPACFEAWLNQSLRPMSRLVARDLAGRVAAGVNPRRVLADFMDLRRRKDYRFAVVALDNRPVLACFPLQSLAGEELGCFASPSAAAEAYYCRYQDSCDRHGPAGEMRTLVARTLKKLRRRRDRIVADQRRIAQAEELRQRGELLLAQLHRVPRGADSVKLDNYYLQPPRPVTIDLDPRLTPQQNAEKLFRAYKKVKRSREHIVRRLTETDDEICWLEGVALALAEAGENDEFLIIRGELEEHGLLAVRGGRTPARHSSGVPGVRESMSPNGFRIFWGVNNRANDYVSKKLCGAEDLWFHAQDMPGCHLVLKRGEQRQVPEADLLFAAALAAGYSRGKNDGTVNVMVSEGRWVVKPKGAKPGLVTVRQYQTLRVAPQRQEGDGAPR